MSLSPIKAVQIVQAVRAAKQRIPPPQRKAVTYFSDLDIWQYQAVIDGRICQVCRGHEDTDQFQGTHLRAIFPYLEIVDRDTIEVNAHPNCRCYLNRVLDPDAFITYIRRRLNI